MNFFDILCIIAALILLVTAVARLNDIKRSQSSKRWWFRRFGLLLVTICMVMFIASYFTTAVPYWKEIMQMCGLWGFALTWITTPGMPPWHKYISRHDPKVQ